MKRYLYTASICSLIAIWTATGIGCAIQNKVLHGDCWEVAVTNALPYQKKGYDCSIWFGIKQHSWKHTEASVMIDGERYWLVPIGRHSSMAQKEIPRGFEPVYRMEFWEFVHYMYGREEL